jgi:hypothetical protein
MEWLNPLQVRLFRSSGRPAFRMNIKLGFILGAGGKAEQNKGVTK